jgi:hypothetical protein
VSLDDSSERETDSPITISRRHGGRYGVHTDGWFVTIHIVPVRIHCYGFITDPPDLTLRASPPPPFAHIDDGRTRPKKSPPVPISIECPLVSQSFLAFSLLLANPFPRHRFVVVAPWKERYHYYFGPDLSNGPQSVFPIF